jgi:hypothetical protein
MVSKAVAIMFFRKIALGKHTRAHTGICGYVFTGTALTLGGRL